jgi:hypothetical protein
MKLSFFCPLIAIFLFSTNAQAACWKLKNDEIVRTNSSITPPERGAKLSSCNQGPSTISPANSQVREGEPLYGQGSTSGNPKIPSKSEEQQQREYVRAQEAYQRANAIGGTCERQLRTYQCKRELSLTGDPKTTMDPRSGPNFSKSKLYHEYLCVRTTGDDYVCGGQTAGGNMLLSDGAQDNVSVFNQKLCKPISTSKCVSSCVREQLSSTARPKYGVVGVGTNCQGWSGAVIKACIKSCR